MEILGLGLKAIELEYRINNTAFQQMRPFLGRDLTILSIHNYFPLLARCRSRKGAGEPRAHYPEAITCGVPRANDRRAFP
ncbi:MAG: hypothetical protein JRF35_07970 [Deltaproteobacteria bacterium]|nr:hypothetical protein [Deltaproteobacteria bacterium]